MSIRSNLFTGFQSQLVVHGVVSASTQVYEAAPEPLPISDAPIALMYVDEPQFEQWTMGSTGTVAETYNVTFRLYLGPEDMTPALAMEAQYAYADKWREAMYGTTQVAQTLEQGLGVYNTTPQGGSNNLKTYRDTGEPPYLEYTIQITEHRARNASAS